MGNAQDIADIKARLQKARDAYESLMLGGQARAITDSDGSKVEYTAANVNSLLKYIRLLEIQLANAMGQNPGIGSIGALF